MPPVNTSVAVKPLLGLRVLVTRPLHQARGLCELIEAQGGSVWVHPVIEIRDPADPAATRRRIDRLSSFDIVIFISANAAERGLRLICERGKSLQGITVIAVGPATAARLYALGVGEVTLPAQADTEGLLDLDALRHPDKKRILIFRGADGRPLLGEILQARGACVDYAEVYRRTRSRLSAKALLERWEQGQIDVVITTSSEGLRNLFDIIGERQNLLLGRAIAVMNERMAVHARELGCTHPIVAADASDAGLLAALVAWRTGWKATGGRTTESKVQPNENG
ncbi:MAG: uroporphyrinogen-III synthase [Pseudomonadota bacterium]|nr:uroporphyrinogen-III synthase [Pseudomonadota bacterium]